MRAIYAVAMACLLACLTSRAAIIIHEGTINLQEKPMDQGGLAQWDIGTKVGNTGTVRFYTESGDDVYDPTSDTVTFWAGPDRDRATLIEVASSALATNYVEFTFSTNDLAYPFGDRTEAWYSAVRFVQGSSTVSSPEGHITCSGAPEVDGGHQDFTYSRNFSLWTYLNTLLYGPYLFPGASSSTTNARGQVSVEFMGSYLVSSNNLSDLDDAATARTNLGLGTAATNDVGAFATGAEVAAVTGTNIVQTGIVTGGTWNAEIGIVDGGSITNVNAYTKTITISASNAMYTTIQAALDANTVGGELFLVYPGTYSNDTINLTANNQQVKGACASPKCTLITGTSAISDFGATTGGVIDNIKMVMTLPANTLGTTVTGTGSCNYKFCHVECTASGINSDAGGSACYDGAGNTVKVVEGSIVYANTTVRGSKGKKAVNVEAGSSWTIDDVTFAVTGSGTSSSMSAVRDTSTGSVLVDKCSITVTDSGSTATYGVSVVNGNGDVESKYNDFHIVNNTGIASGVYLDSDDTPLSVRSSFNHIHATSSGGSAYWAAMNDTNCTLTSQMDDMIAADGVSLGGGTLVQDNSADDGNHTSSGTNTAAQFVGPLDGTATNATALKGNTATPIYTEAQTLQDVYTLSTGGTNTSIFAVPGQSLSTLYQTASTLTPNGSAISTSNRASLVVYPGTYPLTADFVLSNDYVDVVSATGERDVFLTGNTVDLTATHVTIRGLDVGTDQYIKMASARSGILIDNCRGGLIYGVSYWSGKTFSGTCQNSTIGSRFCLGGTMSGTVSDCTIGIDFGRSAIVSGTLSGNTIGSGFCQDLGTVSGTFSDNTFGTGFCNGGDMTGDSYRNRFADASPTAATGAGVYVGCINGNDELFGDGIETAVVAAGTGGITVVPTTNGTEITYTVSDDDAGAGGNWWTNQPSTALDFTTNSWSADKFVISPDGTNLTWGSLSASATNVALADLTDTMTDTYIPVGDGTNLVLTSPAGVRTDLGLVIGTDVEAHDAAIAKTDEAETLTGAWDIGTATNLQIAGIDATGTPSGTTYLRGDGAWETPAGGGASFDLYGLKSVMIDWHQGEYQEGPTTNSAGVMTPWDYINASNSWATYSWYSADTNLQSTYNVGFVYIPTWAASWGTTAMQYRVVSTSTNAADNYSTLNIMDGSNSYSVSNLVSATAENWTAWTDIALASLPASMTNLTTLDRVILRQHFYAKSSNEIGRVELKCNFAQ